MVEISLELPRLSPERQKRCPKEMRPQTKARGVQNIFVLLILLSTLAVIFVIAEGYTATKPVQDMVQFWAAARLIEQNPYSLPLVWKMERSVGTRLPADDAYIVRNPPWSLLFFLPLRPLSYPAAYGAWTVLSIILILGCGRALWRFYAPRDSLLPAFLCLLFGPTFFLLDLGQSTVLVLLGITMFLLALQRENDWLAGSALVLVSIKPHIALLFLLAVALWAAWHRRWKIFAAGSLALLVSTGIVVLINPHIFGQYLQFVRVFTNERAPYPNLGGLLYLASGWRRLALLPEAAGLVWLGFYWWFRRDSWDWKTDGSIVLLVSLACSYYSYGYDEIIALPALLAAAACGNRRILLAGLVLTNVAFAMHLTRTAERMGLGYMFMGWTACAWLLTYLLSQRHAPEPVEA